MRAIRLGFLFAFFMNACLGKRLQDVEMGVVAPNPRGAMNAKRENMEGHREHMEFLGLQGQGVPP